MKTEGVGTRLKHAWDVFRNGSTHNPNYQDLGVVSSRRPDRPRLNMGNERSIVNTVYNKIAMDVAAITIRHVRLDQNGRYKELVKSKLSNCLTTEANIDQTGRALIQDAVISMFDEGSIAIVPVDTTINPEVSDSYEIDSLRIGEIVAWYPKHIRVRLYNDRLGIREEVTIEKKNVGIVENPLYSIMNEPNSTLKRLITKLNLLDSVDKQSGSGKLDLIIQLPYVIKNAARKKQADERRADIEAQLKDSKYGIAYTDGSESVTQLNRPAENNLMGQIEYLTSMLFSQLGLTESVFNGTADEKTMLNYHNRTIEPILSAITDEIKRKFLTKTARSQNQDIMFFRDPFKLVPVSDLADIADKFTRNEILSSNEMRSVIGYKPSNDPKADELRNKNLNQKNQEEPIKKEEIPDEEEE